MQCPECQSAERQEVKETRPTPNGVRRKRQCRACNASYSTVEAVDREALAVIKVDGRSAPFDDRKLFVSLNQASHNWLSADQVRALVRSVTDALYSSSSRSSVSSTAIGTEVLERLKRVNSASHIRFSLAFLRHQGREGGRQPIVDARSFNRWLAEEYSSLPRMSPAGDLTAVYKIRTGRRENYDRSKLKRSVAIALKGSGTAEQIDRTASQVTNDVVRALVRQPIVTSGQISAEVMRRLRVTDDLAYLRYASTAKQFATDLDFFAEARSLEALNRDLAEERRSGTVASSGHQRP